MARSGYFIENQKAFHFVTFTLVYWIDLFTRTAFSDVVINSFRHCRIENGLRIHGYVIMPNHIHAILSATQPRHDLSSIIGNMKKYTANRFVKMIKEEHEGRGWWIERLFKHAAKKHVRNVKHQVWTHDNHPIELENYDIIQQKLEYIHNNPVVAGYVSEPEHWRYSSASNYQKQLSVFKVDTFEEFVADA